MLLNNKQCRNQKSVGNQKSNQFGTRDTCHWT